MGKSEGEPRRSDGQPCPALQKIQESLRPAAKCQKPATSPRPSPPAAERGEFDGNGEVVPIFHVSPETLAAIGQILAECEPHGPILPDGPLLAEDPTKKNAGGKWKSSRKKVFGLLLLAAGTSLVSGLCYGFHCQTHANHKDSEARNFNCHTKVGRRRSTPDGPTVGNEVGTPQPASGSALTGSATTLSHLMGEGHLHSAEKENRPECVVRAECCVNRLPDGRCQTTNQPCRLFVGTDDIRAMLSEIRAGVVGLAMEPPAADEFERSEVRSQNAELRGRTAEILQEIGRFQYRPGFEDVWFGGEHYDLRKRRKARLCLEYLVARKAFDVASARHFENEIDPYVRKKGRLGARGKFSDIQIKQYFNDREGRLPKLRKALIRSVAGNGKYYLSTGAT